MRADLFSFYERTLHYVRREAAEFARRHRGAAEKLLLNPDNTGECRDPHVERLIEAFAYLAAGIHLRLEDDFAGLTGPLLEVVAPHLLAPIPSVTIVQLEPTLKLDGPVYVPAGAELQTRPIGGSICRFRTAYPLWIWPIDVAHPILDLPGRVGIQQDVAAVLRVELRSRSGSLRELMQQAAARMQDHPDESVVLRFYIDGGEQFGFYDLIFGSTRQVLIRDSDSGKPCPVDFRPVGLDPSDRLWSSGPRSLDSYGLLQEYFACPKKFLFFDLVLPAAAWMTLGTRAEVLFLLDNPPGGERPFSAVKLRLSCTPAVNLFRHTADDIRLDHTRSDYLVEPNASDRNAYEVYAVQRVTSSDSRREFLPLYSQQHLGKKTGDTLRSNAQGPLGYYLPERRAPTLPGRTRTEVYLSFVDLNLRTRVPTSQRVSVQTLCTSGDLTKSLDADPGFVLSSGTAAAVSAIRIIESPTHTRRPSLGRGAAWKLISHLSLNYLSMGDHASDDRSDGAVAALRELLLLHAAHAAPDTDSPLTQQILGLSKIETRPTVACPSGMSGPCRGLEVTITLDSPSYRGLSQLLFASVLERFLGRYVSINSFTKMVARDRHKVLKEWTPRAGDRVLI